MLERCLSVWFQNQNLTSCVHQSWKSHSLLFGVKHNFQSPKLKVRMDSPVLGCLGFDQNFSLLTTFIKLLHPVFPDTIFHISLASCRDDREQQQRHDHLSHGSTLFEIQVWTEPDRTAEQSRTGSRKAPNQRPIQLEMVLNNYPFKVYFRFQKL